MPRTCRRGAIEPVRAQLSALVRGLDLQRGVALETPACGGAARIVGEGALPRGAVHEFLRDEHGGLSSGKVPRVWLPPLCIFTHLAWQSLAREGAVVWVGRRVWPYPRALCRNAGRRSADMRLLARSVFIDPPDDGSRLWAIDLAVRCPAVTAVIADGSRLSLTATRRLQLAAETGDALMLLARPMAERDTLSAAATRWRVEPVPARAGRPQWQITLRRAKGRGSTERVAMFEAPAASRAQQIRKRVGTVLEGERWQPHWLLAWDDDQGVVAPSAEVVDRSRTSATDASRARRAIGRHITSGRCPWASGPGTRFGRSA